MLKLHTRAFPASTHGQIVLKHLCMLLQPLVQDFTGMSVGQPGKKHDAQTTYLKRCL